MLINGGNFVRTKMGHACDDSPLFCVEYYSGTPFMLSPISTASHDVSYTMPQRYSFLTPGSVMKALLETHLFLQLNAVQLYHKIQLYESYCIGTAVQLYESYRCTVVQMYNSAKTTVQNRVISPYIFSRAGVL